MSRTDVRFYVLGLNASRGAVSVALKRGQIFSSIDFTEKSQLLQFMVVKTHLRAKKNMKVGLCRRNM